MLSCDNDFNACQVSASNSMRFLTDPSSTGRGTSALPVAVVTLTGIRDSFGFDPPILG
jgi:hypothetical protein